MVFIVGAVLTVACSGSTGGHDDGGTGGSGGVGAFDPLDGALAIHGAVRPDASCESPTVLDPELTAPELTAQLQAIGSIADGSKVRSPSFFLPIRLCERCLAADCPAPQVLEGSCIPGQDGHPWCSL